MKRHLAYLKAVLRHKWFVFLACFRFGVPVWSALLHDWDKFMPDEWLPYARTFYKPDGVKQYVESVEFARAWMQHQHRNKHHWQWWLMIWAYPIDSGRQGINFSVSVLPNSDVLVWDRGEAQRIVMRGDPTPYYDLRPFDNRRLKAAPMSDSARREMLADWFGAGRAYNPNWTPLEPQKWYEKNKDKMILHPDTRVWVESELAKQEAEYHRDMKRITLGL